MLQKIKKIKKVVILLPILIIVITSIYIVYELNKDENIYKDTAKVMNTINQILDLNTVKYNYSNVITVKKNKSINDFKIPFTETSYIIKYNGVINGGVKPENLDVVQNDGNQIEIEIKECEILEHYIDSENIYIYDIKNSIFNKLEAQEIIDDINKYKDEYEKKAIQEGLMLEIKNNTKESIAKMLKNIGYKDIVISFQE